MKLSIPKCHLYGSTSYFDKLPIKMDMWQATYNGISVAVKFPFIILLLLRPCDFTSNYLLYYPCTQCNIIQSFQMDEKGLKPDGKKAICNGKLKIPLVGGN